MKIISLFIYPIKSMAGIEIKEGKCLSSGFEYDREWMLLDGENKMLTQREIPEMALFKPQIKDDSLSIHYQNNFIKFPIDYFQKDDVIATKVWDDEVHAHVVSYESGAWFSKILGREVKLVKIKQGTRKHLVTKSNEWIEVSLADGYPYLFLGTKSIELLSKNHGENVAMNRFRPNVVIDTKLPHEEDELQRFEIGEVAFTNVKACARCNVVTIDQQTSQIDKSINKTLATYRKFENKIYFGTNIMALNEGVIKIGDEISRIGF